MIHDVTNINLKWIDLMMQTLHPSPNFSEKVKDFDPREGFRAPIFISLVMMGVAQRKRAREWIKGELAAAARQTDEDRERFELHRRLGRFALDMYDAVWAGTRYSLKYTLTQFGRGHICFSLTYAF